jgi:small subunit ribosomal protein S4
MRYTGPKHKLARREGLNILEKTSQSLDRRLNIPPGVHGKKRTRKLSEYGIQLREKQKLKRIYGLTEKQFKKYIAYAQKKRENTEDALVARLETRLDNIIYRLGFGKTRAQARQMVAHRHILVNGKKVSIPSYSVREGDAITLSQEFMRDEIKERIENQSIPPFLEREDFRGKVLRSPTKADVANPVNYQLVIEFYSR